MFQESLVESTPLLRTHNRWPVFISVAMQAAILALAVTIPLLHPEVLPRQALNKLDFLAAPIKPPTPPPPPPPVRVQTASESSAPVAPQMQAPQLPTNLSEQLTSDLPPVDNAILVIPSGPAHPSSIIIPAVVAPPAPHVAPIPATNIGPVRISEGVLAGNLISPIRAQYPAIARVAGVQGIVVIQAIISKTGAVESAHIVSGPPMLQGAALDAVRSARYHPYMLDHQPTEVETTFSINFRLGNN